MSSLLLTFIRHGETDFNAQELVQGDSDIALNELGRKQAKLCGLRLMEEKYTRVYSSDLVRAAETCKIILEHAKNDVPEVKYDPKIREKSFGEFEGRKISEMIKAAEEAGTNLMRFSAPGGETHQESLDRGMKFLNEIFHICDNELDEELDENILVVTHGMQMLNLMISLHANKEEYQVENFDLRQVWMKKSSNTSKTTIRIHQTDGETGVRRIEVLCLVDADHLENNNI